MRWPRYEAGRRPQVESLQRAAQASLEWFESVERYHDTEPLQFAFNLLTRSLRITHENLKVRDPGAGGAGGPLVRRAVGAPERAGRCRIDPAPPPLFTPYRLRELVLPNRIVVSSMCQYRADDGLPNDWHLVHLGSRAIGGAGLVMTEMTDVSREGRISPGCAGMYLPAHVAGWRRIVDFVHGESRGQDRHSARARRAEGLDLPAVGRAKTEPLPEGNWPLIAPSPIPYQPAQPDPAGDDPGRHGPGGRRLRPRHRAWPTRPGSICSSCTWRTATCWPRSSRRSPTGAPTSTAARSPTGCATRWRS